MKMAVIRIISFLILLFPTTSQAAEVFYYSTDNVGTPVAMWDKNGKKVWEGEYYPFGEEYQVSESPKKNDKRFIGKEKDKETGLTSIGSRYYDEGSGRFISPDPVRPVDAFTSQTNQQLLLEPQRLNRYAYGLNNPYRYIDPDGEFAVVAAAIVGAAIAYFSAPDIANAPESSSTPTFESHGARNITIGAATGGAAGIAGKTIGASLFRQSAYDIAVGGGRHAGQLRQFTRQNSKQLLKSIKSYNKRISEHKKWIKNPNSKVPSFNSLSREHQGNLIHHWSQDIKRAKELKSIAKKVLKKKR